MNEYIALLPPPHWPSDITIRVGEVVPFGQPVFVGSEEPWSRAYRISDSAILEWRGARFGVTAHSVTVDAAEPEAMLDLYWNSLTACVAELRGTPTLHGFMAISPSGRGLAVVGPSGFGKTTTGRVLLDLGCELVSDDLMLLAAGGVPPGRPFVRCLAEAGVNLPLDIGGKWRMPATTVSYPARLDRVLVLAESVETGIVAAPPMTAVDHLLRNPYLPFESHPAGAQHRLEAVMNLIRAGLEVFIASPRSMPAVDLARHLADR